MTKSNTYYILLIKTGTTKKAYLASTYMKNCLYT